MLNRGATLQSHPVMGSMMFSCKLEILNSSAYRFSERSSDVAQGRKYGPPSEDQTHHSSVIVLARQAC